MLASWHVVDNVCRRGVASVRGIGIGEDVRLVQPHQQPTQVELTAGVLPDDGLAACAVEEVMMSDLDVVAEVRFGLVFRKLDGANVVHHEHHRVVQWQYIY